MNKRISFLFLSVLCVVAYGQKVNINNEVLQKLYVAETAVNNFYVDSVNEEKLIEDAIRGMLKELDPHSSYTTAQETKNLTESLQGSFEGVGIQFNVSEDTLLVIQTIADGPSERAGLLPGDRIVSVNDTAIAGVKMSREEMMRRLRGKKGTIALLGVVRRGIADTLSFRVKRDKIPVNTIDAAYMITPSIGYIRIGSFGATTHDEFLSAVDSLQDSGMRDLIIDEQGNGGGYLQSAVQIANEFLNKGDLIVYTEGRMSPRQNFFADGKGRLTEGQVVILLDEYSASAAEILAGAIQDSDRGTIVGRRSYGKGLVQRPIEFTDGSMMRLTVAHYYTPSGRCIQKPYTQGGKDDYYHDIEHRYQHGEFYSADSIHFPDSLRYYTLREGRVVYGGGGIMPDYFVPLDTLQYTRYHRQLSAKGIILGETLKYADNNRKALKKEYRSLDTFITTFTVPESLLESIYARGDSAQIEVPSDSLRAATIPMLQLQVKALIARDLWNISAYYKILNGASHIVTEALAVLRGDDDDSTLADDTPDTSL